jgi:flagellar biogenesis protein FliO
MSEKRDEYPVTGLHTFLQEATVEFRRFRLQALVNLVGSIIILLFLSRFFIFLFGNYGPPPFEHPYFNHERPPGAPFVPDFVLLVASLGFVLWSVYVLLKQRRFVSRWGERFEKLGALEKKFLPDENH